MIKVTGLLHMYVNSRREHTNLIYKLKIQEKKGLIIGSSNKNLTITLVVT